MCQNTMNILVGVVQTSQNVRILEVQKFYRRCVKILDNENA